MSHLPPLDTPVLLLVFTRLDSASKVFEAIRQARPRKLYIGADGPREGKPGEREKCEAVRNYLLQHIDWDCQVHTLFREHNLGCGLAPSQAISWMLEHEEYGIVLEDDCLPSPSFFWYCQEVLQHYLHDERVMHVAGQNYHNGWRGNRYSYYFSSHLHSWGWATWRRAWQKFDFLMGNLPEIEQAGMLPAMFPSAIDARYYATKYKHVQGIPPETRDIWDYQWDFAIRSNHGLCIVPHTNLVSNIGFGAEATHTFNTKNQEGHMVAQDIELPLAHPPYLVRDAEADRRYTRFFWSNKVVSKARQMVGI